MKGTAGKPKTCISMKARIIKKRLWAFDKTDATLLIELCVPITPPPPKKKKP